ncbi:MAG TPA: hypothetical protein VHP31_10850 [Caproicibacter sp.]|nr:hypothetical protein [Caproicibacter sp.]
MNHEKILGIIAWAFTAAAIFFAVYSYVTHQGGIACAMLMTMALASQYAYGKEIKRKYKNEKHEPYRRNRKKR